MPWTTFAGARPTFLADRAGQIHYKSKEKESFLKLSQATRPDIVKKYEMVGKDDFTARRPLIDEKKISAIRQVWRTEIVEE